MSKSNSFTRINDNKKRRSSRLKYSLLRSDDSTDNEVILNLEKVNDIITGASDENIDENTNRENEINIANSERRFSLNDFSKNMNELCLKTPERIFLSKSLTSKITPGEDEAHRKNALPLFDITFDDSDNEGDIYGNLQTIGSKKPLADAIVFVDVRAENENRSKAISRELERLGATIAEKIGGHVTHIVFKDGRKSTLNQLKKYSHIHFVSVLWVDSCKTLKRKVNEGLYPAKYPGSKDQGLPMARAKRVKSLQPKTFEEDVSNSAKREERRKRKFKKLDKNYGTPKDQVICLDSQEYIKSSDLHKLVATPLAIPDTPWIINYINGSSEDTTSPDGVCANLNRSSHDVSQLSQDVQCRLTFVNEMESPSPSKKRSSCLVSLGVSPSESVGNEKDSTTQTIKQLKAECIPLKRKSVAKGIATKTGTTKTTNTSKESIKLSDACPPFKRKVTETSTATVTSTTATTTTTANETVSNNTVDITINNPMKKKKRLLSKIRFALPQEKLISPALRNGDEEKKDKKKTWKQVAKEVKKKHVTISTNQNCPPNAFTMLQKLQNSKKEMKPRKTQGEVGTIANQDTNHSKTNIAESVISASDTSLFQENIIETQRYVRDNPNTDEKIAVTNHEEENSTEDDNTEEEDAILNENENYTPLKFNTETPTKSAPSVKDQDTETNLKLSTDECPLQDGHLETPQQISAVANSKGRRLKRKSARNSALNLKDTPIKPVSMVEDKDMEANENLSTEECPLQETPRQTSSPVNNDMRRSRRKSARNSSFDFKVSKNFRKPETSKTFKKKSKDDDTGESSEAEDDQSTEDYLPKDIDPSVSFVHDETDGLVCTAQKDGVVFKLDISEESMNKESCEERVHNSSNSVVNNIPTAAETTGLSIIFDSDSGISDSEEISDGNNVDEKEEKEELIQAPSPPKQIKSQPTRTQSEQRVKGQTSTKTSSTSSCSGSVNGSNRINATAKRPKHSVVFTSLHFGEQDFAKNVVKELGGFKVKTIVGPDTSHIVSGEGRRTLNILHGIIKGCWIVSPKWVSDSLEEGHWLDEEDYEMSEAFSYAKISRLNRIRNGKSSCTTLFAKLPRIYLAEVTSPSHEEMMRLITSCSGKLTNTVRKAGIAVGMVTCRRNDMRIVSEKWILDSISNGRIMPTKTYEYRVSFRRERSPDF